MNILYVNNLIIYAGYKSVQTVKKIFSQKICVIQRAGES
jgi:hypothetical protein